MIRPKAETFALNICDRITELEREIKWCDNNEEDSTEYKKEINELERELRSLGY